ncbi:MAG: tRNA uridine-5-carboxymethylaminomethyl(34) synthesis enzyme MnmG [Bacilli bacterium]|nr:tRNA uridine-5-carboxymethylaminomethyl(34) synthesis enzyme MnmG [Bacilli bacterium]
MYMNYEIIVVGGGHAGCEAALASARKGHATLLLTGRIDNIATMPCNPSIGGSAKGIVVREIDALGGEMGHNADKTLLQMKLLNNKKGPAVRALRAQADKVTYPKEMLKTLQETEHLTIQESLVEDLIVKDNQVQGVVLENGEQITSKAIILTTGTYMKADVLIGDTRRREGPHGEKPSLYLSEHLEKLGFKIIRLKTGTPQRIEKDSIDYTKVRVEPGDDKLYTFSHDHAPYYKVEEQVPCYITYTTEETHQIIRDNLSKSSMYGGLDDIKGIGPRYCPSIEDKVVRFADKEKHQLFVEPESLYYDEIYLQGFSTSMPKEIQDKMVHSLPGFENAVISKYGYAIEYDAIYPTQLKASLETKLIQNLFTAGQINGTSGYEEAACQGLIAGINASLKIEQKEPLILKRNDAYIGVLIDDLITKGVRDPYRLLTSRAEYRLLLRHDNADMRLRQYGYDIGLIDENRYQQFVTKNKQMEELTQLLKKTKLTPKVEINTYFEEMGSPILKDAITLYDLLKRQEWNMEALKHFINIPYDKDVIEEVELTNKYEGYLKKAQADAEKMVELENKKIPSWINYDEIKNIASEARQKLKEVKPVSIGQAIRISGVNPADISILMIYIKRGQVDGN